eukprot:458011_1
METIAVDSTASTSNKELAQFTIHVTQLGLLSFIASLWSLIASGLASLAFTQNWFYDADSRGFFIILMAVSSLFMRCIVVCCARRCGEQDRYLAVIFIAIASFSDSIFDIIQGVVIISGYQYSASVNVLAIIGTWIGFTDELLELIEEILANCCEMSQQEFCSKAFKIWLFVVLIDCITEQIFGIYIASATVSKNSDEGIFAISVFFNALTILIVMAFVTYILWGGKERILKLQQELNTGHKHRSIESDGKVKDLRLNYWLHEEDLMCLGNQLDNFKYEDLRLITKDDFDTLISNTDLNQEQVIRFGNALNFHTSRYNAYRTPRTPRATTYKNTFKLIIVGDCNVGKSCILARYVSDDFQELHQETNDLICEDQLIEMPNKDITLQIFDMCAAHTSAVTSRRFFVEAHGALIVYDVTNQSSFDNVNSWLQKMNTNHIVDEKAWKMLVANKIDLNDERVITKEQGQELGDILNIQFMECSAKIGQNIEDIFHIACQNLLRVWDLENPKKERCLCC